jgi:hypothetical protein
METHWTARICRQTNGIAIVRRFEDARHCVIEHHRDHAAIVS